MEYVKLFGAMFIIVLLISVLWVQGIDKNKDINDDSFLN